jgi:hypothetical protein
MAFFLFIQNGAVENHRMVPVSNNILNCSKEITPLKERRAGNNDNINPITDSAFRILSMVLLLRGDLNLIKTI